MDFKNSGNKNKKTHDPQREIQRIKDEIDEADRIFQRELQGKYKLLENFDQDELKQICADILRREPESEYFEETETGKQIKLPLYRNDYVHFIIEELQFSQIKEYALERKIIPASFFEK